MKKEIMPEALYNYNDIFYFSIPEFIIKTKIDLLKISIQNQDVKDLIYDFLVSNGFESIHHYKLDKINYAYNWQLKNLTTNTLVEMIYGKDEDDYFLPGLIVKIHDLDEEFWQSLGMVFKEFDVNPNLSYLELAFDFHSNERRKVQRFLVDHLFMKYQRIAKPKKNQKTKPKKNQTVKSKWCKTTFYYNPRKFGKNLTVYLKEENDLVVRMELRLRRRILKRMNIQFPLSDIDSLQFHNFFSFMEINIEKLRKYLIWCERERIKEINRRRPGYGNLVIQQIDSWMSSILDDSRSLREKVEALKSDKGVPNYSRFLRSIDWFNKEFLKQVSSQNFIKS